MVKNIFNQEQINYIQIDNPNGVDYIYQSKNKTIILVYPFSGTTIFFT
jgi:hypothetical protein